MKSVTQRVSAAGAVPYQCPSCHHLDFRFSCVFSDDMVLRREGVLNQQDSISWFIGGNGVLPQCRVIANQGWISLSYCTLLHI